MGIVRAKEMKELSLLVSEAPNVSPEKQHADRTSNIDHP